MLAHFKERLCSEAYRSQAELIHTHTHKRSIIMVIPKYMPWKNILIVFLFSIAVFPFFYIHYICMRKWWKNMWIEKNHTKIQFVKFVLCHSPRAECGMCPLDKTNRIINVRVRWHLTLIVLVYFPQYNIFDPRVRFPVHIYIYTYKLYTCIYLHCSTQHSRHRNVYVSVVYGCLQCVRAW